MAQPKYIKTPGRLIFDPPYALNETTLYCFGLEGKQECLQKTLNISLNDQLKGTDITYEAMGDYLMFALNYTKKGTVTPESSDYDKVGTLYEAEIGFWVPVIKKVKGVPVDFMWYIPYIFVNNPYAMALGREVFGFPKEMATMDPPDPPDSLEAVEVSAWSFKTFGPNVQGAVHPLVTIQESDSGFIDSVFKDLFHKEENEPELIDVDNRESGTPWKLIFNMIENIKNETVPLVYMRQFPSCEVSGEACFQEILEAPMKVTELNSVWPVFGKYQLNVNELASHPFADTLGIKNGIQDLEMGIKVQMNFNSLLGKSIHKTT